MLPNGARTGGELTKKVILFFTGGPRLVQGGSWRSPGLQNGAKLPPDDPKSVILGTFLEPFGPTLVNFFHIYGPATEDPFIAMKS